MQFRIAVRETCCFWPRGALFVTGGSHVHGANKPELQLGTGRGRNLRVPEDVWERLRGA